MAQAQIWYDTYYARYRFQIEDTDHGQHYALTLASDRLGKRAMQYAGILRFSR